MKALLCIFTLSALLSGCAVYTPSGAVVVDPVGTAAPAGKGGRFCPPGQAKKGNC